jgi:hypothetical protein
MKPPNFVLPNRKVFFTLFLPSLTIQIYKDYLIIPNLFWYWANLVGEPVREGGNVIGHPYTLPTPYIPPPPSRIPPYIRVF